MEILKYYEGMEIPETCIVIGLPNEIYHAHDSISKSSLDTFDRSPAHYHFANRPPPTRAMVIGSAIHAALLEPEVFAKEYAMLFSVYSRTTTEYKQAAKAYGGDYTLTAQESLNIIGMQEASEKNPDYKEYTETPHYTELSFFGVCDITGLKIRCRFDLITHDGRALDVKKTKDSRAREFTNSIVKYRYHVQHAFYSHVYRCVRGFDLKSFEFFAIEDDSPYANKVVALDDDFIKLGYDAMLANLKHMASGYDPTEGVYTKKETLQAPEWYLEKLNNENEKTIDELLTERTSSITDI